MLQCELSLINYVLQWHIVLTQCHIYPTRMHRGKVIGLSVHLLSLGKLPDLDI